MIDLTEVIIDNINFFSKADGNTAKNLCQAFQSLENIIKILNIKVDEIENFAHLYDFSVDSPGNGYRSFTCVCKAALKRVQDVCKLVQTNRSSIWFRPNVYEK